MNSEVVRVKSPKRILLQLDLGPSGLELLLDLFGVSLGDVFLDGLWRAFNEILRFLEAQPSDGADFLDAADLVRARFLEDDGELCLLDRGGGRSGCATRRSCGNSSSGGNAPLAFEVFNQRGEIDNRLARKPLNNLVLGDVANGTDDLFEKDSGGEQCRAFTRRIP